MPTASYEILAPTSAPQYITTMTSGKLPKSLLEFSLSNLLS